MSIARWFTDHPTAIGESYGEHCGHAARLGGQLLLAGMACLVHAVLPFLFASTASRTVDDLHAFMHARRRAGAARHAAPRAVAGR